MEIEIRKLRERSKEEVLNTIYLINNEIREFAFWSEEVLTNLTELNREKDGINEEIVNVNASINEMQSECANLNKSLHKNYQKLNELLPEMGNSESTQDTLTQGLEKLELQCEETKKSTVLSSKDKLIFDMSRQKLDLYSEISRINWDYTIPLSSGNGIGYVRNKDKNYVHAFEVQKNKNSTEAMWMEIEKASDGDWSDIVTMTNI